MKAFKNGLLRAVVRLGAKRGKEPLLQHRILVVATTALGDTLWATPALASLRKSFPDAYLAVLAAPLGEEVLRHNPWTDKIYVWEKVSLRLWRDLVRERFDTVLVFHASQRLVLPLCAMLGASRIVGTSGLQKGLDDLLTDRLPNDAQHEIVRRLKMVECIGGKVHTESLSWFVQPEERGEVLPPGRWIALHPGSKDLFKRWPAEHFIAVGQALKEKLGCQILVTGSASEKGLMERVASQIPGAKVCPNLPLRSFAGLLSQISLLISNDTGPVHLACALNVPVLGIYSSTNPALCGPYKAKGATVLYRLRTCEPCLKKKCLRAFCMLQISPEHVIETALGLCGAVR